MPALGAWTARTKFVTRRPAFDQIIGNKLTVILFKICSIRSIQTLLYLSHSNFTILEANFQGESLFNRFMKERRDDLKQPPTLPNNDEEQNKSRS